MHEVHQHSNNKDNTVKNSKMIIDNMYRVTVESIQTPDLLRWEKMFL